MSLFNSKINIGTSLETCILSYCTPKDVANFERASRDWRIRCSSDAIWKIFLVRLLERKNIVLREKIENINLKEIYIKLTANLFKERNQIVPLITMSRIHLIAPKIHFNGEHPNEVAEYIAQERKKWCKEIGKQSALLTVFAVITVALFAFGMDYKRDYFKILFTLLFGFLAFTRFENLIRAIGMQKSIYNDQQKAFRELTTL